MSRRDKLLQKMIDTPFTKLKNEVFNPSEKGWRGKRILDYKARMLEKELNTPMSREECRTRGIDTCTSNLSAENFSFRSGRGKKSIKKSRRNKKSRRRKLATKYYCGPAGKARKGSFPIAVRGKDGRTRVNKKKCIAAMSYSRHAPNPCGIYRCVSRKCGKKFPKIGQTSKKMKACRR